MALAVTGAAAAERDCSGAGAVSNDSFSGAARVRPTVKQLHFVRGGSESAACPDATPACRKASYVVPGDFVLTGRALGSFVCALFGGKVWAWLPLEGLEATRFHFADWYGYWSDGSRRITIQHVDDEKIAISAELYGLVISGVMAPQGDRIEFAVAPDGKPVPVATAGEKACTLRLRIVGPYLLAENNNNCGAAAFRGIYGRV